MFDPLTITTACIGLINGITILTMHINVFVNDVRGARKDMDLISRELASLSLCLGALRTDCQSQRIDFPEISHKCVTQALLNIDMLMQQVKDLLQKLSSGRLGRRIQWTVQGRETVDRLRSSLETQKSVIEVALQCGSIQILCSIQKQAQKPNKEIEQIKNDTRTICEDTGILRKDAVDIKQLILEEAGALRAEISSLQRGKLLSAELCEFLNESQIYSRTVSNPFATPEPSDSAIDASISDSFSARSSIVLPSELSVEVTKQGVDNQGSEVRFTGEGVLCTACGGLSGAFSSSDGLPSRLSFSGVSTIAIIPDDGQLDQSRELRPSFVFKWPYPDAKTVYVTGTFDEWGKENELHKNAQGLFQTRVFLPSGDEKYYYKFVVDDQWIIDPKMPWEDDGHHNVNNIILPSHITNTGTSTWKNAVMRVREQTLAASNAFRFLGFSNPEPQPIQFNDD